MEADQKLRERLGRATDISEVIDVVRGCFEAQRLHFGHGTDNASDEAAWLVYAVLAPPGAGEPPRPTPRQLDRITDIALRRVMQRKPLAYLLHEGWFAGLRFYVDERVLIPRSPLAEVIERQLSPWVDGAAVRRALDLGTGSGCLAIALATYLPDVLVDASDSDRGALTVARFNVSQHQLAHRVRVLRSDLFAGLGRDRYEVIVTNPPYVPAAALETLPPEYAHEPRGALVAGRDGLRVAAKILEGAGRRLTARGVLVMEVGEAADALVARYPSVPFTWLEFARGGEGVLVLTAGQLCEYFAA